MPKIKITAQEQQVRPILKLTLLGPGIATYFITKNIANWMGKKIYPQIDNQFDLESYNSSSAKNKILSGLYLIAAGSVIGATLGFTSCKISNYFNPNLISSTSQKTISFAIGLIGGFMSSLEVPNHPLVEKSKKI